jgi:hypothetical protein
MKITQDKTGLIMVREHSKWAHAASEHMRGGVSRLVRFSFSSFFFFLSIAVVLLLEER